MNESFAVFTGQGVNHLSYGYGMIIKTVEKSPVVDVKFRYTSLRLPLSELLRAVMPEDEHQANMEKYYPKPEKE